MTKFKTTLCALSALLLAATASAEPPSPADVAQQCVQQIVQTTQSTVQAVQHRTQIGVARIHHLASADAPAPVIFASAHASRDAIKAAAHHGARAINTTAVVCLWVLDQLDAPPAPRQAVINAREQGLQNISSVRETSLFILGEALMNAVGDPGTVQAY